MLPRLTLLTTCVLLLLPAAGAEAKRGPKPQKGPKTSTFKATAKGSQATTWSYHLKDDPNDPCDSTQDGDGSQMVVFESVRAADVSVVGRMVTGILPARATVTREGDYRSGMEASSDCGPEAWGDDELPPLTDKDCGTRSGRAQLFVEYGGDERFGDLAPLHRTNNLMVTGDLGEIVDYENCPWWIGGPPEGPSDTELLPSGEPLSLRKLHNPKRKVIKLSGDYIQPYTAHGFEGQTIVTWNLTLRRVR